MIDKGQEIFDGTVSQLKETFGKMKTLSFELLPGQRRESLTMKACLKSLWIDRGIASTLN